MSMSFRRVVVVGLTGSQEQALSAMVGGRCEYLTRERLLRQRVIHSHVVLCRCVSHKHSQHAKRIAAGRVEFIRGGIVALAAAIRRLLAIDHSPV
jgi:hypothetical protein